MEATVDSMFDAAGGASTPQVKGGASGRRIDNKRVPGAAQASTAEKRLDVETIPRRPGESGRQAVARVRTVIGSKISDHPALRQHWESARAAVTKGRTLSPSNYADLYDQTRAAFWRRVRNDPAAVKVLNDAGFDMPGGPGSAPSLDGIGPDIRPEEARISLDHIAEKAQGNNWQKALDADNLQFEFAAPNTEREVKQMRHPELR